MPDLETVLTVPDLWQQKAVNLLRSHHDVIVNAPTGSGKTFIFEHLVENTFSGKAVFTVPTRALANDKLNEWIARGWNVGIETGDVSINTDAPIVIATLETQKRTLISGKGPRLLVIDEYQMLGDKTRGLSYELAIALAPPETQLLLLSGSVANSQTIEKWLKRCGRNAICVNHPTRPVPLDEVHLEALPNQISKSINGKWPRLIARALAADLGPILVFSPRRKLSESLARSFAATVDEPLPLALSAEQQAIAGQDLARCLKNRVAFHHSGMSYAQRAGLVEALAKKSQLRVIVATTGLAAGINFSVRSVLVLDREYRTSDAVRLIRPDELLQMFGRAGRRGLDQRGSVLYISGKPRLRDARPLQLKRENIVDWPSLIDVIQKAIESGVPPLQATRKLTARLFSTKPIPLGLDDFLKKQKTQSGRNQSTSSSEQMVSGGTVTEFFNSEGIWERRRATTPFQLKETLFWDGAKWRPGLSSPKIVSSLRIGSITKEGAGKDRQYGIEAPIARFPQKKEEDRLELTSWIQKALRNHQKRDGKKPHAPKLWTLQKIENQLLPILPSLTKGGKLIQIFERKDTLLAQLDYSEAIIHAYKDSRGCGLLNPPIRRRKVAGFAPIKPSRGASEGRQLPSSVTETWFQLGLINERGHPTRRGKLFSFFNYGEGLAIAAALETHSYPLEELFYDLANIRAGHRFYASSLSSGVLTAICQETYGVRSIPGYLRRGVPEDYGEGAGELFRATESNNEKTHEFVSEELSAGDIERTRVEWRSLRAHVAFAPKLDWARWSELQDLCRHSLSKNTSEHKYLSLPQLTRQQKSSIYRLTSKRT